MVDIIFYMSHLFKGEIRQPSLMELENLLSSQESLAHQMVGSFISGSKGDALFPDKNL